MAKRVDVSRLSRHQLFYIAGFKRGLKTALAEARTIYREEVHKLIKELVESRADFQALAILYHKVMIERAAEEAQHERETHPGRPLH